MKDIYQILHEIKSLYGQFPLLINHAQTIIHLIEKNNQNRSEERIVSINTEAEFNETKMLDITDVISLLNISESTYYRWVRTGELEPRRKGKRHYFYLSDLREQLAKSKMKGRI